MLERYELEAFLTLAEELHFGRTAERLRVSTARISQSIRKLERRVGAPLFERTSRRVELTPLGRELHAELRPAWTAITDAVTSAVEAGRGVADPVRVCFTGAAAGQLLVGAAELYRERHPGGDVQIREAQRADPLPWLREGEVDLALTTFPVHEPGVEAGPVLVSEARFLALPVGHRLAGRAELSAEDLASVTLPEPRPTATFQEILTLVGAGRGAFPVGAHTRRYYARPDVAYVHLPDAPPVQWGLVWLSGNASTRVRAFAAAAHDLVAAHR
ncbi:LysR family transcriptional regulator [Lentzea sp. NPDC055074]